MGTFLYRPSPRTDEHPGRGVRDQARLQSEGGALDPEDRARDLRSPCADQSRKAEDLPTPDLERDAGDYHRADRMAPMTTPKTTFPVGGDVDVRRVGFGAMRITGPGISGPPPDPAAARALLRRAVELGVQLIDTADVWPRRVRGAHRRSSLALRRPPHRDQGRLRTRRA